MFQFVVTYVHCPASELETGERVWTGYPRAQVTVEAEDRLHAVVRAAHRLRAAGHGVAIAWADDIGGATGFTSEEAEELILSDPGLAEGFDDEGVQIEQVKIVTERG